MKVAFVAFEGCALWQVALLLKFMRDHGHTIRTLTLEGASVLSDSGIRLAADGALERVNPRDFGLLLMAGVPASEELAEDPRLLRFLRQFNTQPGALIAASCASSVYVAAAGLLGGLRFTAVPHVFERFRDYYANAAYVDADVVVDGNVITSKGHAHYEFMLEVAKRTGLDADPGFLPVAARLGRNEIV